MPLLFFATIFLVVIRCLVKFAINLFNTRRRFLDLPCPPHSFLFGNLIAVGRVMKSLPRDVHPQVLMSMIGDTFNLGDVYFIDLWPLQEPFLIIKDHNAARKIMQEDAYPKHPLMKDLLHPVSGDSSIGTSEGQEWRMLRSVLSSSFSQNRLLPLVSEVLQEVLKFRDKMVGYTRTGETFSMLNDVTYLTFDVIGLRLLGSKLESQQEHHPLVYNFLMTKAWLPANTDVIRRNMVRIMTWWYSRKVDHWLRAFVKKRFEDLQTNETEGDCTLNILLQAFTDEKLESMSKTGAGSLDSQQMLIAVNNIKALLLAGHDTTASEFAYTLFLLFKHALARSWP